MESLKEQILSLQAISSELEPSAEKREHYLRELGKFSFDFIDKLPLVPAFSNKEANTEKVALSESKLSFDEFLSLYQEEVVKTGIKPASGGHLGYIPGGGIYTSALADYLVAVTNEYVGINFSYCS